MGGRGPTPGHQSHMAFHPRGGFFSPVELQSTWAHKQTITYQIEHTPHARLLILWVVIEHGRKRTHCWPPDPHGFPPTRWFFPSGAEECMGTSEHKRGRLVVRVLDSRARQHYAIKPECIHPIWWYVGVMEHAPPHCLGHQPDEWSDT